MVKIAAPKGLGSEGKKFWDDVLGVYEMRIDERSVLEAVCRSLDRVVVMRAELDLMPLMLTGSTGQQVVNPLVAEIRAHEAQVASLLGRLKLPDADGNTAVSNQARAAAQSRWAMAHGKGA